MGETTTADGAERHEFSAEVGRLLDLVVHSLYSEREIFLRELVANAADAIDRRRFEALTEPSLATTAPAGIRIAADKPGRTLAVSDDGIGMRREEMVANLGTIARSGTRAFGQSLASSKASDKPGPGELPSLIGQFGVGFYAAFMVSERVEVTSRRAGEDAAWTWSSDGGGGFSIEPGTREAAGTTVVLRLKSDADEFLEPSRLETIVRKWADHITVPITISRDGRDEPANEGTAVWRRAKSEVSEADAEAFYRHLGNFFGKAWATLQWRAEGALEYYAMLFIPDGKPFMPVEEERESRLRLHVRRMFITDRAGLLPPWLRFVQGVVDTEDLPLNVSREMLQATPVLARIRKAVTNRVLTELKSAAKDSERYEKFWDNFGAILKEGVWDDAEHRPQLAPLLRFRSTHGDGWTSLPEYVSRMKPAQKSIYFLAGDDVTTLRRSAQIEGFRARGLEVLLLDASMDAFWPERLDAFEDKKLRSVTQAAAELADLAPEVPQLGEGADVTALLAALKAALGDAVSDVRSSDRLVDSAVVLVASADGPDLQMQRLLRRAGRSGYQAAPALEVNPRHALIAGMAGREGDADFGEVAGLLLDVARVQDGEAPRDPAAFARAMERTLVRGFAPGG